VEHVGRDHGVVHDGGVVASVREIGRERPKRISLVHDTDGSGRNGL